MSIRDYYEREDKWMAKIYNEVDNNYPEYAQPEDVPLISGILYAGGLLVATIATIALIFVLLALLAPKTAHADTIPTYNDKNAVLSIIGEAEDQTYHGMKAIACTLRNRALIMKNPLKGVYGIRNPRVVKHKYSPSIEAQAMVAWETSLNRNECTFVKGATGWGNSADVVKFKTTTWWKNVKVVYEFKDHVFYKEVK